MELYTGEPTYGAVHVYCVGETGEWRTLKPFMQLRGHQGVLSGFF